MRISGEDQLALETRIMRGTTYRGVPAQKLPMDAWVYQEIIHELRPAFVVEIGNAYGGSLRYLADLCDLIGGCRVIGVDIDHSRLHESAATHPRVTLIEGETFEAFEQVEEMVGVKGALVIEDSSHTTENTLDVMRLYRKIVPVGGYLIVEDGVMPTVTEAIVTFLLEDQSFERDKSREWPLTWNPRGYLRRIK